MRKIDLRWILLAALLLAGPLQAKERSGELAPPEVQKEQDQILKSLTEGNKRHIQHRTLKSGLAKVMIVSCADSRVPPETVFNMKPGELFTNRAFGNIVDKDILASLEYGAVHLNCRVLVVLGHTKCSALKDAIAEHDHPRANWDSLNEQDLDAQLQPAVSEVEETNRQQEAREGKKLEGDAFLDAVVKSNVLHTMHSIREQSPLLWKLENSDMLRIVGAVYDLESGKVEWIKE